MDSLYVPPPAATEAAAAAADGWFTEATMRSEWTAAGQLGGWEKSEEGATSCTAAEQAAAVAASDASWEQQWGLAAERELQCERQRQRTEGRSEQHDEAVQLPSYSAATPLSSRRPLQWSGQQLALPFEPASLSLATQPAAAFHQLLSAAHSHLFLSPSYFSSADSLLASFSPRLVRCCVLVLQSVPSILFSLSADTADFLVSATSAASEALPLPPSIHRLLAGFAQAGSQLHAIERLAASLSAGEFDAISAALGSALRSFCSHHKQQVDAVLRRQREASGGNNRCTLIQLHVATQPLAEQLRWVHGLLLSSAPGAALSASPPSSSWLPSIPRGVALLDYLYSSARSLPVSSPFYATLTFLFSAALVPYLRQLSSHVSCPASHTARSAPAAASATLLLPVPSFLRTERETVRSAHEMLQVADRAGGSQWTAIGEEAGGRLGLSVGWTARDAERLQADMQKRDRSQRSQLAAAVEQQQLQGQLKLKEARQLRTSQRSLTTSQAAGQRSTQQQQQQQQVREEAGTEDSAESDRRRKQAQYGAELRQQMDERRRRLDDDREAGRAESDRAAEQERRRRLIVDEEKEKLRVSLEALQQGKSEAAVRRQEWQRKRHQRVQQLAAVWSDDERQQKRETEQLRAAQQATAESANSGTAAAADGQKDDGGDVVSPEDEQEKAVKASAAETSSSHHSHTADDESELSSAAVLFSSPDPQPLLDVPVLAAASSEAAATGTVQADQHSSSGAQHQQRASSLKATEADAAYRASNRTRLQARQRNETSRVFDQQQQQGPHDQLEQDGTAERRSESEALLRNRQRMTASRLFESEVSSPADSQAAPPPSTAAALTSLSVLPLGASEAAAEQQGEERIAAVSERSLVSSLSSTASSSAALQSASASSSAARGTAPAHSDASANDLQPYLAPIAPADGPAVACDTLPLPHTLPINIAIRSTLVPAVRQQCSFVQRAALAFFLHSLRVREHLLTLQHFFLFRAGPTMDAFTSALFHSIRRSSTTSQSLQLLWLDALRSDSPSADPSRILPIVDSADVHALSAAFSRVEVLNVVDSIRFHYTAPPAVAYLLHPGVLAGYGRVFTLLMRLAYANSEMRGLYQWLRARESQLRKQEAEHASIARPSLLAGSSAGAARRRPIAVAAAKDDSLLLSPARRAQAKPSEAHASASSPPATLVVSPSSSTSLSSRDDDRFVSERRLLGLARRFVEHSVHQRWRLRWLHAVRTEMQHSLACLNQYVHLAVLHTHSSRLMDRLHAAAAATATGSDAISSVGELELLHARYVADVTAALHVNGRSPLAALLEAVLATIVALAAAVEALPELELDDGRAEAHDEERVEAWQTVRDLHRQFRAHAALMSRVLHVAVSEGSSGVEMSAAVEDGVMQLQCAFDFNAYYAQHRQRELEERVLM